MSNFIYTKQKPTHLSLKDACEMLRLSEDDFFQLSIALNERSNKIGHKYIHKLNKKSAFFLKKYDNELLSKKMEKKEFEKTLTLPTSNTYSIEYINKIYNSKPYKALIENIQIKKRIDFMKSKGRRDSHTLNKVFNEYNYTALVMEKYTDLDLLIGGLGETLSILYLFQKIFNNESIKGQLLNRENFREVFFQDVQEDIVNLDKYLLTLDTLLLSKSEYIRLQYLYPHTVGYYYQITISGKELLFVKPLEVEMEELTPIFFYNFKMALNHLKVYLYKYSADYLQPLLFDDIINTPSLIHCSKSGVLSGEVYCIDSIHRSILHLLISHMGGEVSEDRSTKYIITDKVERLSSDHIFIHPQYIFDSFNSNTLLKYEEYKIGSVLPRPVYPFKESDRYFSKISEDKKRSLSSNKRDYVEHMREEENKDVFY